MSNPDCGVSDSIVKSNLMALLLLFELIIFLKTIMKFVREKLMRKYCVLFHMVTILSMITILSSSGSLRAETETKTVAVFPFEVMAKGDIGFIGKGMGKMLCSRIATDSNIVVRCLDRLPSEFGLDLTGASIVEKIAGIAELNGVDFLLTGAVTIAGESVSSDAKLMEVMKPEQVKYMSATGSGMGDIMSHASAIAEQVRAAVHGQPSGSVEQGGKSSGSSSGDTSGSRAVVINRAGDGAVKGGVIASAGSAIAVDPMAGAVKGSHLEAPLQSGAAGAVTVRKTLIMQPSESAVLMNSKLNMEIRGMATADIDGDGVLDLTVIDDHSIMFFTFSNNTLVKKGDYKGEYYNRNISIDAIDINKNGRSELFITALGKNSSLKSYVLEWNGREFEALVKDAQWYFRVVSVDGSAQLLGQKRGHDEIFTGSLYNLDLDGKSIVRRESIASGDFEIFGFSPLRRANEKSMNSSAGYFVWFDRSGFLNLGDDRGAKEWTSPQSSGSTPLFVELDRGKDQLKERVYINNRVVVTDIDQDKQDEIVTVTNSDAAKGYLAGYRKFTQGRMQVMGWRDGSMVDLWIGNPAPGYISDFNVMDMDGDGYSELIYAVVTDAGLVMNKMKSTIFIQKIAAHQK